MSAVPPSFVPPSRLLLGPGPSPIDPRILQAFTRPTLGHLDPIFLKAVENQATKVVVQRGFTNTINVRAIAP